LLGSKMIRKTYYYAYGGFQFPLLGSFKHASKVFK